MFYFPLALILPNVILAILYIVFLIPLFIQNKRITKEIRLIEEQNEKIKALDLKQEKIEKYKDFTEGHLYQ